MSAFKACVYTYRDVPPAYRDDYDRGYDFTRDNVKHQTEDFIFEEAFLAREQIKSGSLSEASFWYYHGVLTAIARATGRCPHCNKQDGPCNAAGKAA